MAVLTVLEAKGLQGLLQAALTLKALKEDPFLLLVILVAPGVPWLVATSVQFLPVFTRPSL